MSIATTTRTTTARTRMRVEGLERRLLMATFGVTTTADSGPGSLRQAILDANAAPGADIIQFGIAGGGAQTITPLTPLPALSDTSGVAVDGTTAAGFAVGAPVITINGASAGTGANGFQLTGGNNVIQGLIVQNFDGDQIEISGGGGNSVFGNILTGNGTSAFGDGVEIDSANNRVGGPNAADRNVIGGNATQSGVRVMSGGDGSVVENNRIGTNAAGTAANANSVGITLTAGAASVSIIDNLISGNTTDGILLTGAGADSAVILGNFIGTDAAGTGDLGNGGDGVSIEAGASDNSIGATGASDANTIAFNNGAGVAVAGSGTGNAILRNVIFSNTGLGIDLGTAGRTANDANDADTGANDLQNFPAINSITPSGGSTTIAGALNSTANTPFRIEFFTDTAGAAADVEGRTFLGSVDVATNASGVATFNTSVSTNIPVGQFVVATATAAGGALNTSEFSDPAQSGVVGADIQVSGNNVVIASGDPSPDPGDLTNFGSAVIGGTAVNQVFTITNTGGSTLDLTAGGASPVTITGPGAGQFSVIDQPNNVIGAGQSSTFTVAFAPTAAGNQTATVSIVSSDADENPYTFAIAGQGSPPAPAPEIEVSGSGNPIADGDTEPSSTDLTQFGNGTIGATGVTRTFVIANAGQQDLSIGAVTIGGTGVNPQQFSVVTQPSTTVAPGQQTSFAVRFSPVAGGQFTATVSIPNNDADENPYDFSIRGIGVAGSGNVSAASLPADVQPPAVPNNTSLDFVVRYTDDQGLSAGTFDNGDLVVTGPNGFSQAAAFVSVQSSTVTQADVLYRVDAPGGTIDGSDNGTYTVTMQAGQVSDTSGNDVPAGPIGTLDLNLSTARTSLGQFGIVNGRRTKLTVVENDGTVVTLSLSNGIGEAFRTPAGRLDLEVSSAGGKLTATAKRGNKRIEFNDILVTGSLAALNAKAGDVTGVVSATQALTSINLGSLSGATVSTPSAINAVTINGNVADSQIWSGADLGDDGRFGGTGPADDAFAAGSIKKFNVSGAITDSLIAAGLDPVDGELLNGNGAIVGGAASSIGSIKVRGDVDAETRFAAGAYPAKVRFGNVTIVPIADPRFDMTP